MPRVELHAPVAYDVVADGDAVAVLDQTSRFNWGAIARILIPTLIVPELIYFSRPLDIAIAAGSQGPRLFLFHHPRTFAPDFSAAGITAVPVMCIRQRPRRSL